MPLTSSTVSAFVFSLSVMLIAVHEVAAQAEAKVTVPDTPAGRRLEEWLSALNSGSLEKMHEFTATGWVTPPRGEAELARIAASDFAYFQANDGVILLKASTPAPNGVTAYVKSKRTGFCLEFTVRVAESEPHQILGIRRRACEVPEELLPSAALSTEDLGNNLDRLLNELIARDKFSGVVLVAQHGAPVYSKVAGMASRAWNAPNELGTRFNLASITKLFTAVAVAQLVEQGRLAYDDEIGKFVPALTNQDVAKVTLQQLLSHTSGLKDDWPLLEKTMLSQRALTVAEWLAPFHDVALSARPGERYEYCNIGYAMLGIAIEKASGENYFEYIQKHVFDPAGMHDSGFLELDSDPPRLATGYMDVRGQERRSNTYRLPVRGGPFGLAYATAPDMAKFAEAVIAGKLVSRPSLEEMWTGRLAYGEIGTQYGLGCIVRRYNGTLTIGHGGGWHGITNRYEFYPEQGYAVVVLTNIDSDPNPIVYKIREWLTQGR